MYNKYYLNELQYIIDTELNNNNLNYKLFYMCLNTELINTKINKIIAH